jgi:gliding motility-associated-like protein
MRKLIFIFIALIPIVALSQQNNWTKELKTQKAFIENKGQFNVRPIDGFNSQVEFAFDGYNEEYFFTKTGVVIELSQKTKRLKTEEEKKWRNERKKQGFTTDEEWLEFEAMGHKLDIKKDELIGQWIGSNPNVQIISEDKNQFTHSYSYYAANGELKHVNNAPSFNKLTYKNIYPNIDVIYELHPNGGLKYSVIVRPGGDISTIKLNYSKNAILNSDGTINTSTIFGNITDHKPVTFYEDNQVEVIASSYRLTNNTISFNMDNYNTNRTIVIDPWTQTPAVSIPSGVWEIEADAAGNVYVIGGGTPMQLVKYNSAGVFQWIYNTPYDTNNGDWLGALATDNAGNSYVTRGSSAALTKVNTTGGVVYSVNGGSFDEYWQISFNCDQTKLLVGGTRLPFFPTGSFESAMIFDVNPANGSVVSSVYVGWSQQAGIVNNPDEVRSITSSFNAKYYFLTLDSIAAIDQMLGSSCPNPLATGINSTYNFSYKCEDFRPDNGNGPMSAIVADANFVYTQNGNTVHKRDLNTYGILATAAIPGGITTGPAPFTGGYQAGNSGIAMDNCGNVYVGSSDRIIKYDGNLNLITSTAVPYRVSDVEVSPSGEIVLCGSTGTSASASRTGYVQSVNMSACAPTTLICCDANFCLVGPLCTTDAPVNLNPNTTGGTWSSSPVTAGLNTSTGVFSPSVAGAGTYTITYTLACGANSIQVVVGTCSSMTACVETNGNLTVSGGVATFTWATWTQGSSTPITNQTQCQACGYSWVGFPLNQCLNGATPVTTCSTASAWVDFGTGTTVTPPVGADTIRVTDGLGGTLVINGISSLPSCSATCTATITPAGPFCVNAAAVNLTAAQTGGTWSGTGITNASTGTFNPATAGAGNHTITYTLGCGDVDTETIVVNALDNAGFSYSSVSYCLTDANPTPTITGLAGGTFTINNSGVINASTGVVNITGSGVGSFTVTYTTNGPCPNTATFNITITSSTDATITQAGPFCSNAAAVNLTAVSSGGTWTGTGITDSTLGTFNPATAGVGSHEITYTITGSCGSVDTMTIVVNAATDASFTYPSGSYCMSDPNPTPTITGTTGGTFTINSTGVINSSTGLINLTGSGLGSYTVTYTTAGSCPDTNTFDITITNTTNATITQAGPFCLNAAAVNLTAVSPGGNWTGTGITNATLGTFNPTTAGVGSHVITYTISGSCGSVDTMTIVVNAADNAAFSYSTNTFCLTSPNPSPTITGLAGGTFTINNGGVINSSTGVINLSSSGAGAFTVTYTTNGSCPSSQIFNLNINNCTNPLPVANFSASPTSICVGACVNFTDMSTSSTAGGITTWAWTFTGAVTTSSSVQNPTNICYSAAGTYQVVLTVTDANGTDTETKIGYITVSTCTPPTVGFTISDTTICAGSCITFTNNSVGATLWQWTFENGTPPSSTNQNPGTVCFNSSGTQEVKLVVSNAFGSDSIVHYVTVFQPQQIFAGNDTIIQLNQSVNLNATGVVNGTYTWTPPVDLTCTTCPNPTATPEETITYTIIASDTNGCRTTDNITIIVDFDNVIFVPNIFSPNGDGVNDILFVRGKGVAKLKFFVYDRWGEKVFETTSLDVGWDGSFRGKDMNKAVFVYYLEATFIDGKEVTQKGDITLVK